MLDINAKAKLQAILVSDEGINLSPYKDTNGVWTYGIGHLIGDVLQDLKISKAHAFFMLQEDMEIAIQACANIYGQNVFLSFSEPRQLALICMAFQLGESKLRKFIQMNRAIAKGDWILAAAHAEQSKWALHDSPERAERIITMLRSSIYPYSFSPEALKA